MYFDIGDLLEGGPSAAPTACQEGPQVRVSRAEDRPFQPSLVLQDAGTLLRALGIRHHADALVDAAVQACVANLVRLVQLTDGDWIFYSRDNDHYAGLTRYVPKFYRRLVMVEAVDWLVAAGVIVHRQTRPSPKARLRSRLQPTPECRALLSTLPAGTIAARPQELIFLRGADRRPKRYRDTDAIADLRRDVEAHNAFLRGFDITVAHPSAHLDAQGFLGVAGQRLDPGRKSYYRVFNGDFGRGGRWYGPWWQGVPKLIRGGILINGEPTAEPDIRGCHIRLLFARAGLDLGDVDPYVLPGLPRTDVKATVNIMLNADNWYCARGALADRFRAEHGAGANNHAERIRAALRARFPVLSPFWNSGCGLYLQNIDADICRRVQRALREDGVPCLSVHDSFLVPRSAERRAEGLMAEEFDRTCHRLRRN